MTILPLHPADNAASPEALRSFLADCAATAVRDGHAKLVSISLAVDALDPLAVLESIYRAGRAALLRGTAGAGNGARRGGGGAGTGGPRPGRFAERAASG
jgi:hypothetical protein